MADATQQVQGKPQEVLEHTKDDYADLLSAAVGAKSDQEKSAISTTIDEIARWAVAKPGLLVEEDAIKTLSACIREIDRRLTDQINLIIHDDDFKALEGTWRGLHHLINNTETDELLKIKVMNISKKEITKDLKRFKGVAWDQSPLFRKIYSGQGMSDMGFDNIGGHPFGCLIGDYYFDHSPQDVDALAGIAQIAAAAHAPFFSAAAPSLAGFESWQQLNDPRDLTKIFKEKEYLPWQALRQSEDSRFLGLTMPRFLGRQPYGSKTVPVEEFAFEEDAEGGDHTKYLWCNAAYAMGVNIARAFKLYGWCTQIRGRESGGTVPDLPFHTFPTTDGDTDIKCPTEIAIPDRREAECAKNGLIPLCYVKNSTDAVFMGAQSLQEPKKYIGKGAKEANESANLSARLPYLFAACRFAHYLKCIIRDKIGKQMTRNEVQRFLQDWINNYVLPNPEDANDELKAKKPLSEAQVEIKDVEGNPGYYTSVVRLKPHFQLEGINVSIRLVGTINPSK
jgi:type VI secretion system protein ImpC